ncbi:MAG TPA: hypothetical protein PK528_14260 [Syntrophorhabdus sp.]|nr:hypothetical protein [Syntrophorhabdus sp.]
MDRITRHPGPAGIPCRHNLAEIAGSDRNIFLTSGYQKKYNEVFDKKQGKENLNYFFSFMATSIFS